MLAITPIGLVLESSGYEHRAVLLVIIPMAKYCVVNSGFQYMAVVLDIALVHWPGHPSKGSHSAASPQALNVEKYSSPTH